MAASGIVTLLFTDLVGSTELLDAVGDDAAETLRRRHFHLLREQVENSAGQEVKNLGDGLMVVFNSAVDAVTCAVGMQRAVDRHNRSHAGSELRVRIGLHVGEPIRDEGDYFGLPVVLAQRLCNEAEGGQILASELVAGVVGSRGGFGFQFAGEVTLRAGGDGIGAYEVPWRHSVADTEAAEMPFPHLLGGAQQFAFAGRGDELQELVRLWKEAADGQRHAVLLAGEPGIGKTRLAAEVATIAHAAGATVLYGRCDEELGMPFQPFVEALRFFADHTPGVLLAERLGRYPGELARVLPELNRGGDLPPALRSDPETERYRLFDAVADWLATVATEEPVVLVLDDLHWADKPTLLMLRHVIRSVHAAALFIVGTHRDAEVDRTKEFTELLADLRRTPGVERVALHGLDRAGVLELMERASGHAMDKDGIELARTVHAETEGNPFFVGEVLRHLAESGAVYQREGRWVSDLRVDEMGIPEGVREVMTQRLSRLSEDTNRLLRAAAAIGRDFAVDILQDILELSDDDLIEGLEEATEAQVIEETRMEAYRFTHVLVRTTLYEGMGAARRVRLHQLIAQAIEARRPGDISALAHHYAAAGQVGKALEFTVAAAERALAQLAFDQAVALYERALELFEDSDDAAARCDLVLALGEAQRLAGTAAYRETLLEASALARHLEDTARQVRAALANHRTGWAPSAADRDDRRVAELEAALEATAGGDNPAWRARLLATLAAELTYGEDIQRRLALGDEALGIARGLGDDTTLAHVLVSRFQTICAPDTLSERTTNSAELLDLAARTGDPFTRWFGHYTLLRTALEAGEIDLVEQHLAEVCRMAEDLNQPYPRWSALVMRANGAQMAGHLEEAERLANEGLAFGTENAQPDAFAYYAAVLIPIRWDQGRLHELAPVLADTVAKNPRVPAFRPALAIAHLEAGNAEEARAVFEVDAATEFREHPVSPSWLSGMCMLAEVCAWLGHADSAPVLYRLLGPWERQVAFSGASTFGSVARPLGLLATVMHQFAAADRYFQIAAATTERIGAPTWLARTQLDHARALLLRGGSGDRDRAVAMVQAAAAAADPWPLGTIRSRTVALLDATT